MPSINLALPVWKHLQELLSLEASPYLDSAKFVLQKDAFVRLSDEDIESDVPFAAYEYHEVVSDESLDFAVYFFASYFFVNIGPAEFVVPYGAFGFDSTAVLSLKEDEVAAADPAVIAKNIVTMIKMLLNGQIAVGCSCRSGELMAIETFLMGYELKPLPLALVGNFSIFKRKSFDYTVKQNRVLSETIKVPDDFPLLPPVLNGKRVMRGREVDSIHDLPPLDRSEFIELDTNMTLHEVTGKDPGKGFWSYFYKTPEFWLVCALFLPVIWYIQNLPDNILAFVLPLTQVAGFIIIPTATSVLLSRRQARLNRGERVMSYELEQRVAAYGGSRLALLVFGAVFGLAALFAPLWTPKNDFTHLYAGWQMLASVPLIGLVPLMLIAMGAILANREAYKKPAYKYAVLIFSLAAVVTLFTVNGIYMNTAGDAPQPPDLAFAAIIFAPLAMIIAAIVYIRKP